MPKKPNAEIRNSLYEIIVDLDIEATFIREGLKDLDRLKEWLEGRAAMITEIATWIDQEAEHLSNAKPLKPRAKNKSPKVTKAMARNIKALAMAGWSAADIAAHFGVNQGRITDVLNGNYGV